MFPSKAAHGFSDYITSAEQPSVLVSVQKLGNGYVCSLRSAPKRPNRPQRRPVSPLAGANPNEIIDKMVDGMGAFLRSINDRGAGEDWKDNENRAQIREAFKVMFPGVSEQLESMTSDEPQEIPEEPKNEQLVFESKENLLKYLSENL